MVTPSEIIASALGAGAVATWFWYDKKRTDARLDKIETKQEEQSKVIIEIKSTRITESKSREISEEVGRRYQAEVTEIKAMVTTMMAQLNTLASNLQTHTAVTKALKEQEKEKQ